MATYSLAVTGARAEQSPTMAATTEQLTLDDQWARPGDQQAAMASGSQVLCKGPDGSLAWYVLDAERSTVDRPVLLKV